MRLADLQDLRRPGDGAFHDDLWPIFLADARIRGLRWPTPVVEQFLFEHGSKAEFLTQYGHLELETLRWDLRDVAASEFVGLSVFEDFNAWLESSANEYAFRIAQRPIDQREAWAMRQTWIVPPLLIEGGILLPARPGLHLLEGHTRIGILRGRLQARVANPDQAHQAFVGGLAAPIVGSARAS
jgi:hypothetical protein